MIVGNMVFAPRFVLVLLLAVALLCRGEPAAAQGNPPVRETPRAAPLPVSSTAEHIFEEARGKLLQIRTELAASGHQTSLGSAFLVTDNGIAITNYHVVSQYVLEPNLYRLHYFTAAGERGDLQLLGFDVADDLAVVRLDNPPKDHFNFDARKLEELTKGERLYAMGNPLDIGFAIVEGTYNGLVERSYTPRIHFSGALNPGMSGGPAVAPDGAVIGVNVATRLGGSLVSFLVPAGYAVALLAEAQQHEPPAPSALRAELGRQIAARQATLYAALAAGGYRGAHFGPYIAAESKLDWFTCWSQTNAEQVPKPRAAVETTNCSSDSDLFVADDLSVGRLTIAHSYARSTDLNAFQFAALLQQQDRLAWNGFAREKWYTAQRCDQGFTVATEPDQGPPVHALWCARAYKSFDALYDVAVTSVTEDRKAEALISRFSLQAVSYETAIATIRQFFEALRWQK
ncbi:MAG TPA: serine protease [Stellaceae bacterium]|nr:serine protease [Stellaceae bacterium]